MDIWYSGNSQIKQFILGVYKMKQVGYIAIDQYGTAYQIGDNPPRKWLLNHFGRQHADKMYCDTKDGKVQHTGYVIAGHWIRVFRVCEWKPAK